MAYTRRIDILPSRSALIALKAILHLNSVNKKVLIVSATYPPISSGGADYVLRLGQGLAAQGYSVHVITTAAANIHACDDVHVHCVMNKWSWLELPTLLRHIKAVAPFVINLHFAGNLYNDHPMITYLPVFARLALPSARFVTLFEAPLGVRAYRQSFFVRALHKMFAALFKSVDYSYGLLLSGSNAIIALAERHRASLAAHYPAIYTKSRIVPPPPLVKLSPGAPSSREHGRAALGLAPEDLLLSYFGYFYPSKGVETLLQAFATVAATNDRARLALIGGVPTHIVKDLGRLDYQQELVRLAESLGIASKIFWSGDFASDSLNPSLYLRATDLCVLPFDAGVCLNNSSFATAAAHGLPIITTAGQTLESPFVAGDNVMLCPPGDPSRLAEIALGLLDDEQSRQRLGRNAFNLAQRWFSWQHALAQTLEIFSCEGPLIAEHDRITLVSV